ncbi:hypothetical protein LSH36_154g01002 [Paralvinella palmiformis]|uniref:Uncharacterized protein n=1 Tax=Paralvinella palmiformis TaxID=53620 RepID=A0AAD9JUT8_9ANNE|nr:hypothetical protein LSH36_154g01002 [Paralvinella palmiformis]
MTMCNTGLPFPAMNLAHPAAAHRGFGVHVTAAANPLAVGSGSYSTTAAAAAALHHQRSPFAIQELLGLSHNEHHHGRVSGITPHPGDSVLSASYISRTLPPTMTTQANCLSVADPTLPSGHTFSSWRPNFMSFSGSHAQSMLNLGAASHGLGPPHGDSSGGHQGGISQILPSPMLGNRHGKFSAQLPFLDIPVVVRRVDQTRALLVPDLRDSPVAVLASVPMAVPEVVPRWPFAGADASTRDSTEAINVAGDYKPVACYGSNSPLTLSGSGSANGGTLTSPEGVPLIPIT